MDRFDKSYLPESNDSFLNVQFGNNATYGIYKPSYYTFHSPSEHSVDG